MPPILAAFFCTVFILWLFRCNAKGHPKPTGASWIATIWVYTIASKPIAAWIYGKSSDGGLSYDSSGETIDRNVLLLLIFAGVVILKRRRVNWGAFFAENRWLLILQFFMFMSTFWSDDPFVALKRWIRVAGGVVIILCILTEEDPVQAIRQVFVRCIYVLIPLSFLVMKYYPEVGVYYNYWTGAAAYCGEATDKNALGRLGWVSALFLLWSLDDARYRNWAVRIKKGWSEALVLALSLAILFKAKSATSLACFLVVSAVYFGSRARWVRSSQGLLAFGASSFIIVSLVFLAVPDLRKIVTGSLGRNADLTERTEVWDRALKLDTNPLVGEGYASFWLTRHGRELGDQLEVNEAHNGFLETYLNTGLIGLLLVLVMLVYAGRNTLRHLVSGSPVGSLYAALFLGGILYNYTEAAINDSSLVGFLLFQLAIWYPLPPKPESALKPVQSA